MAAVTKTTSGSLEKAAQTLAGHAESYSSLKSSLESLLESSSSSFQGQAASAFQSAGSEWASANAKTTAALTEIYEKLKKAADKYTSTDQDEAKKHQGTGTDTGADKGAGTDKNTDKGTDKNGKIDTSKVTYDKVNGSGSVDSYISQALDKNGITDPTARKNWTEGYKTLISRESSGNVMAVNTVDSNATSSSVIAADGNTANCSRGLAQCIPSTFAAYHVAGTSDNIYDPVANIAASMNYNMGHYGVSKDGSDLTSKVQQADSGRSAKGY